jgi:hypothetical protein
MKHEVLWIALLLLALLVAGILLKPVEICLF